MHGLDEARRSTAGAQAVEFMFERLDRSLHAPSQVGEIEF
jgi:hypothetical protein